MLDDYGASELETSIQTALVKQVPHPSAVRIDLERQREARHLPPPIGLALPNDTRVRNLIIRTHQLVAFMSEAMNIILCGPNGAGKSTIAKNIPYQAIIRGHTALFTTAANMLNELSTQDGDLALQRKLKFYAQPKVLVIDEVGYLSYSNRCADLLFDIISRRYHEKSTVITTNKPFVEWRDIFPSATCVVSLIDRLVHRSEIINIEADSYRLKEAKEESAKRKAGREAKKTKIKTEITKETV